MPRKTFTIAARPMTVMAETKKAVAVLKGNSAVEGVVELAQEDDGKLIGLCCYWLISLIGYNVNVQSADCIVWKD